MRIRVIAAVILLACLGFAADSLNCRLVGNWPFGPSSSTAVDPARNLVFCGSGGGAYILDMSNPTSPVVLSDGKFLKLDEGGNGKALAALKATEKEKDLKVKVTGKLDGETIQVDSLALE